MTPVIEQKCREAREHGKKILLEHLSDEMKTKLTP